MSKLYIRAYQTSDKQGYIHREHCIEFEGIWLNKFEEWKNRINSGVFTFDYFEFVEFNTKLNRVFIGHGSQSAGIFIAYPVWRPVYQQDADGIEFARWVIGDESWQPEDWLSER